MQSAVFGYFAETRRKSILCLFFIVTKHLKKLLKVCLLRCAVVGSVMRFSRFFETIQITTGDFRFPYGSPHTFAHEWLNKAFCGLFFLPKFRLVRYLSAIPKFSLGQGSRFFPLPVQETKSPVHSFGNSCLCVLELMTIHVQSIQPLLRIHDNNNIKFHQ